MLSLLVLPSALSLVGDYFTAHAAARDVAFAGQGIVTGNIFHSMMIDAIEERWSLARDEKLKLADMSILPEELLRGASHYELCSSPCSFLPSRVRATLYSLSMAHNAENEDLDPNTRDSVFSPLMHVKVAMPKQRRHAISVYKLHIVRMKSIGHHHQARMLEEGLSSTMSSARNRNLGRVGDRVRNSQDSF